jgi:methionyl-tRNA formyltransferase
MTKISEPIVFFGSGPVAAESLRLLLNYFEVEAVITKPRPAHHTGPVPVLELAEQAKLQTFTVSSKSELNTLLDSRPVRARLGMLIDFGIIVSQAAIDYFELGIVNSHFSLLPEWRGADPITFAILSGQPTTGVSLMLLTAGMDEGPLLAQADYELDAAETTPSLTQKLIELSDHMLREIIPLYAAGSIQPQAQDTATVAPSKTPTYSRKLSKADAELKLTKPAAELEREIRAFLGWPGSRTKLGTVEVIITQARAAMAAPKPAGTIEILEDRKTLVLYCGQGYLDIERLKPAGKKEMSADEFLRGYGDRLQS